MIRRSAFLLGCLLCLGLLDLHAQVGSSPIETFGYFQTSFQHQEARPSQESENSFSIQQLNLLFQKTLSERWLAFINFEAINNFSSSRRWGSFDLDEAWIRYRANRSFTLKVGLHVPTFNHLNEIKNRTPLLPYIVRPLVYEESFAEVIAVEEFIPNRAFLQASGTVPAGDVRVDYAAYLGNSSNINSQFDNERTGQRLQTGVDTSRAVLIGGRAGLRYKALKLGVSATRETVNFFRELAEVPSGTIAAVEDIPADRFNGVPKVRVGVDVSAHPGKFFFEGEFIAVRHRVDEPPELLPLSDGTPPRIDLDRTFYYGTAGYELTDHLLVYGSYWFTDQGVTLRSRNRRFQDMVDIKVFTVGGRYTLLQDEDGFDLITLKAQYAYVPIESALERGALRADNNLKLHIFGLAMSILF